MRLKRASSFQIGGIKGKRHGKSTIAVNHAGLSWVRIRGVDFSSSVHHLLGSILWMMVSEGKSTTEVEVSLAKVLPGGRLARRGVQGSVRKSWTRKVCIGANTAMGRTMGQITLLVTGLSGMVPTQIAVSASITEIMGIVLVRKTVGFLMTATALPMKIIIHAVLWRGLTGI